jgi:hypothetical protein
MKKKKKKKYCSIPHEHRQKRKSTVAVLVGCRTEQESESAPNKRLYSTVTYSPNHHYTTHVCMQCKSCGIGKPFALTTKLTKVSPQSNGHFLYRHNAFFFFLASQGPPTTVGGCFLFAVRCCVSANRLAVLSSQESSKLYSIQPEEKEKGDNGGLVPRTTLNVFLPMSTRKRDSS